MSMGFLGALDTPPASPAYLSPRIFLGVSDTPYVFTVYLSPKGGKAYPIQAV